MLPAEIKPNIYWIGVNDFWTDLFEGLWPICEEGVSLNSYLIRDEKTAVIDLAAETVAHAYLENLTGMVDLEKIDYIIINHMEPDHTGALRLIHRLAPNATLLCTERARRMMENFYGVTERVRAVADGEEVTLGSHTLRFIHTPGVHWPETMMTYEVSQGVLFSCDGFGGYGTLKSSVFDDGRADLPWYLEQALRYYANIVCDHSRSVLSAFNKLDKLSIQVVAPSHGLVWRKDPACILEAYRRWAQYAENPAEKSITVMYGSMYGNTRKMLAAVQDGIFSVGVPMKEFDVARTHVGYMLPSLWVSRGVVIAAPTYEVALFPPMAQALEIATQKKMFSKKAVRLGSYGWGGGAQRVLEGLVATLKWDLTDTLEFVGVPKPEELRRGREFGAQFARLIQAS